MRQIKLLDKSELPSDILEYLNATRFDIPIDAHTSQQANILYGESISYINNILESLNLNAHFCIVYTDSFKTEVLQNSNCNYIIHDRAFGQCINMLNRLFLYDCSFNTSLTYMHKFLSQISSRYGFFNESVFLTNKYKSLRGKMDHVDKQGKNVEHAIFTKIQELFVLLHEVGHISLNNKSEFNSSVCEDVRNWLSEHESNIKSVPSPDAQLLSEAGLNEVDPYEFESYFYDSKLSVSHIIKNDKMIEEFSADRLAFIYLLPYIKKSGHINEVDAIKSIILCFLHLRTLQLLEYSIGKEENYSLYDRAKEFSLEPSLGFKFYNFRMQHIKYFMYDILGIKDNDRIILDKEISKIMYRHSDLILESCFSVFGAVFYDRKFRSKHQKEFIKIAKKMPSGYIARRKITAIMHLI
ncbi:hypothetical protein [Aeromonas caviae]|uniref:hypothetical protein n=1 Tax=Aeromonas caviae TaxID=648 RepID=UPI002B48792E|nr:hypothetical protein [Aeromonas caviae]